MTETMKKMKTTEEIAVRAALVGLITHLLCVSTIQIAVDERDVYVSTILEDLFQYLDQGLCENKPQYRSLDKLLKLRAAMIAFRENGIATYDENSQPAPMMVPTKELLAALQTSRLTTAVKPLAIPAIGTSVKEAEKYSRYHQDLVRSLHELTDWVGIIRPPLFGCELGSVEHVRDEDGTLRLSLTDSGVESIEDGTVAQSAFSDKPIGRR